MVDPSTASTLSPPELPRDREGDIWFYALGREVYGPVSFQRLVELRLSGDLAAEELVWQPHFPDWRPVSLVPGLQSGFTMLPRRQAHIVPLSTAEKFPLSILFGFTIFVILHFAWQDSRLAARAQSLSADQVGAGQRLAFEVEVCHEAAVAHAFVAVGYFDKQRQDWVSRGWYPTHRGECRILLRGIHSPVFVFAESSDGIQNWLENDGHREFCIHPREAFLQAQDDCPNLGSAVRRQHFMPLELSAVKGRVTWHLRDKTYD